MRRLFFCFAMVLIPAQVTVAQTSPCTGEAFQQFDFWLGECEVVSVPDGQFAGINKITKEEGGCLILERWEAVNGSTGQSYNYYNPATQKWRQIWVSTSSMIDYEGGLTESGSMKLVGTITYPGTGKQADFTGEWTSNANGTVTQHFEQYDAVTQTWKPWFTGQYTRIQDTPED